MDKELLKMVYEDLEYITKEWNQKDVSDANLRRSSNILRKLLIDGDIFKVARMLDIKKLRVLSSGEEYPNLPGSIIHQSGGGKFGGMRIKGFTVYNRALLPKEIKSSYKESKKRKNKPIKLHEFIQRPSLIIQNIKINREEIIKYICNKLGGVHYDSKRREESDLDKKYKILDEYNKSNNLAGKNAVYFELLSIGQRLVNNKDIQKLKKKIKMVLSDDQYKDY